MNKKSLPQGINIGLECAKVFDPSAQEIICKNGRLKTLSKGQALFQEGDLCPGFYLVNSGLLKLCHMDSRDHVTLIEFIEEGSALGIGLMEAIQPKYPLSAIALSSAEVIFFTKENYQNIWKNNEKMNVFCLEQIQAHIKNIQVDKTLNHLSLEKRLAYLFLHRLKPRAIYPLTRKDISNWAGTTIESVIRILSQWTKDKTISTHNSEIKLLNRKKLELIWMPSGLEAEF